MTLSHALKEWNIVIEALSRGRTILLLRKGGIKEKKGQFGLKYRQVLLFPTYEHQKPHLLKPDYQSQVTPVPSGWHPEKILIRSWANITDILTISEENQLQYLLPYHIGNEQFASERLHWKRHQPLYLLLLRVYLLHEPILIPYTTDYGGCQSWIDLNSPISLANSIPVLKNDIYDDKVSEIQQICSFFS